MIPKIDLHIHSEFSPCSVDTTIEGIISMAEARGLQKIAITDHGMVKRPPWFNNYLSKIEKARKNTYVDVLTGMEVDIKTDGHFVVDKSILDNLDIVIGALHSFLNPKEHIAVQVKALEINDFDILAHPTWLTKDPTDVIDHLICKLKEENIAIEMNYHHKCPSPDFLRKCAEAGVRIAPSSDAHRLTQIGHFEWFEQLTVQIEEEIRWIKI